MNTLYASLLRPFALDFFKYVRVLHDNTLTETNLLGGLTQIDRDNLITNFANQGVLSQQINANARLAYDT